MGEAAKKQKSICETSFVGDRDANGDSEIEYIRQRRVASTGAARNDANLKKLGEGRLVQSMVLPSLDKVSMERALRAQKRNTSVAADHHCM